MAGNTFPTTPLMPTGLPAVPRLPCAACRHRLAPCGADF